MANTETSEDLNRIGSRAQEILDTIKDVFASNGISLPTLQYLAFAPIEETTHDFTNKEEGQVTVAFGGLRLGITPNSPGIVRPGCNNNYIATYFIEVVRCTPQPKGLGGVKNYGATSNKYTTAPQEDRMNAYGEERMRDVWLLLRAAQAIQGTHSTLHNLTYAIDPGKEDGAVQAVRLTVEVLV